MFFWGFFLQSLAVCFGCCLVFQILDMIITKAKAKGNKNE